MDTIKVSINLNGHLLSAFPDDLVDESSRPRPLHELSISSNQISTIPSEIGGLTELELLDLAFNQLSGTPPRELGMLAQLKVLNLSGNAINTLPVEFGDMKCLEELHLSHNLIGNVPEGILGQLTNLCVLYLNQNQLSTIPSDVGRLTGLKEIALSGNLLTAIPEALFSLSSLRHLGLDNNSIAEIPPSIGALTTLETLHLDNNDLAELPNEVTKFVSLRLLSLMHNHLAVLPTGLGEHCEGVLVLFLGGNNLSPPLSLGGNRGWTFTEADLDEGPVVINNRFDTVTGTAAMVRYLDQKRADDILVYSRDYILKFEHMSSMRPTDMASVETLMASTPKPVHLKREMSAPGGLSSIIRGRGRGHWSPRARGRGRGNGKRRDRRYQSHDDMEMSVSIADLHHTDEAYVPLYRQRLSRSTTDVTDAAAALRTVTSALNKLSIENYDRLSAVVVEYGLANSSVADSVVSILFQKAMCEPGYVAMYAELCLLLVLKCPQDVDFRTLLITELQRRFEALLNIDIAAIGGGDEQDIARLNLLGSVHFIGELFLCNVLTENIVHHCIGVLLSHPEDEYMLEALCKLLTTIGKALDSPEKRSVKETAMAIDAYFDAMTEYVTSGLYGSRATFFLRDLLDLRAANWVPRKVVAKPQSLSDLRAEYDAVKGRKVQFKTHSPKRKPRRQLPPMSPKPVPKPAPMSERIDLLIQEFYSAHDIVDATRCIDDLHADPVDLVMALINVAIDRGEHECELAGQLLGNAVVDGVMARDVALNALGEVLQVLSELCIDVPNAPKLTAVIVASMLTRSDTPIDGTVASLMTRVPSEHTEVVKQNILDRV